VRQHIELVQRHIEGRKDEVVSFLKDLVRTPSPIGRELKAQKQIQKKLSSLGLSVDLFEADLETLKNHPGHTPVDIRDHIPVKGRPNVVGTFKGSGGGRSLILAAHVDHLPVGSRELWKHPPFAGQIDVGRMYGRGVANDKAGIAIMITSLEAILQCGLQPKGNMVLISALGGRDFSEGESGGLLACAAKGYTADAALYLHPHEESTGLAEIAIASMGALNFRVIVTGKMATPLHDVPHAVNAIDKAIYLIGALHDLDQRRNQHVRFELLEKALGRSTSLHISIMKGGKPCAVGTVKKDGGPIQVPESCEVQGRVTFPPGETAENVAKEIEAAIGEAARKDPWLQTHPPMIERIYSRAEPASTDREHPLIECVKRHIAAVTGSNPSLSAMPCPSDIRFLVLYSGTPTVKFGPLGGGGDMPDEWVDVEDYVRAVKTTAAIIMDWCGTENKPGK
jgi:acetylornithine deacetylase